MTREQRVLAAALQSRVGFNSIVGFIDEQDFTIEGWILWEEIEGYYSEDKNAQAVSVTLIADRLNVAYPKHRTTMQVMLESIDDVSVPNVVKEYIDLKESGIRDRLAAALVTNDKEAADNLIEELNTVQNLEVLEDTSTYIDVSLGEVLLAVQPENVIRVRPQVLADKLDGGLIHGTQVAIYAPTEVGKTLLAINMACGFLTDGRKVLYCGNEDPAKSILMRMYSNLADMTKHELIANPTQAQHLAYKRGFSNLVFLDMTPGSISEIRRATEKHHPEIIFIDQMANMDYRSANKVEKNEALASKLRGIAKKYNVITIIIHQASDDSYGQLILQRNQLYYTNVGVQGQMDVMIAIGCNEQYEQEHKRQITLTKNKISGTHDSFPVLICEAKSKILE